MTCVTSDSAADMAVGNEIAKHHIGRMPCVAHILSNAIMDFYAPKKRDLYKLGEEPVVPVGDEEEEELGLSWVRVLCWRLLRCRWSRGRRRSSVSSPCAPIASIKPTVAAAEAAAARIPGFRWAAQPVEIDAGDEPDALDTGDQEDGVDDDVAAAVLEKLVLDKLALSEEVCRANISKIGVILKEVVAISKGLQYATQKKAKLNEARVLHNKKEEALAAIDPNHIPSIAHPIVHIALTRWIYLHTILVGVISNEGVLRETGVFKDNPDQERRGAPPPSSQDR